MKTAGEIFLENGCQHFTNHIQRAMVLNAMKEYAQQEREKAVREFKEELILMLPDSGFENEKQIIDSFDALLKKLK